VEDSAIVEFDEASLFALDRFPGSDRREQGQRTALGIGYTRIDPLGWSAGITAGIVLRADNLGQFTPAPASTGRRRTGFWPRISRLATACASSTARCSTSSSTSPPTSFR
jgi:lipopolysaccharide assembly outer membrane protein LptD (OstA)